MNNNTSELLAEAVGKAVWPLAIVFLALIFVKGINEEQRIKGQIEKCIPQEKTLTPEPPQ